jgi:6-phosphogluconolactonase
MINIFDSENDLFSVAATDFALRTAEVIKKKEICNVVLSGGNTPRKFFESLVNHAEKYSQKIEWNKIRFFFGDERYVAPDDLQSNYHMADQYLFSKVSVPLQNIYRIPTTEYNNAVKAAEQYENTLRQVFPEPLFEWPDFDITYLGMGDNGHTASLMPNTDLVKECIADPGSTSLVRGVWVEALKMHRITLMPSAINHSHHIIFLVNGENKAPALKEVLEIKNNPLQYPAILIKNAVWFVDKEAIKDLKAIPESISPLTLSIDIGGTGVKMMILDPKGQAKTP